MANNDHIVQLGNRTFPVVAQKHARLRHHLSGSDFNALFSKDYSKVGYRLLSVLIPALKHGIRRLDNPDAWAVEPMPEYEFEGFSSQEDWESYQAGNRDVYDDEKDNSPDMDQIVGALEVALSVNGAGRLGKLLTLIQTAGSLQQGTPATQTVSSPPLPGGNGGSPSTSSGTTPQTSTGAEG